MSYLESPYLKELTIYRSNQRLKPRLKRSLANSSLLKDKFADGRPALLMDNCSVVSCEKYSGKTTANNPKNLQLRLQVRLEQFEYQAKKECQSLKSEERQIGEDLLRNTYDLYRTKLDCAQLQRYLTSLEQSYDEEREAYEVMFADEEEDEEEEEQEPFGEGWPDSRNDEQELTHLNFNKEDEMTSRQQCSSEIV